MDNDLPIPTSERMRRLALNRCDADRVKSRLSNLEGIGKETMHARAPKTKLLSFFTDPIDKE
jgi:hypothetical protein